MTLSINVISERYYVSTRQNKDTLIIWLMHDDDDTMMM